MATPERTVAYTEMRYHSYQFRQQIDDMWQECQQHRNDAYADKQESHINLESNLFKPLFNLALTLTHIVSVH